MSTQLFEELGLGFGLGIPCLLVFFVTVWKYLKREGQIQLPTDANGSDTYRDVEGGSDVAEVVGEGAETTHDENVSDPQTGRKARFPDEEAAAELSIPFIGYTYKRFDTTIKTPEGPAELGREGPSETPSSGNGPQVERSEDVAAVTMEGFERSMIRPLASRSVKFSAFSADLDGQDVMAPTYTVPRVGSGGPRADVSIFLGVVRRDYVWEWVLTR